jgi:hypothetical protein
MLTNYMKAKGVAGEAKKGGLFGSLGRLFGK